MKSYMDDKAGRRENAVKSNENKTYTRCKEDLYFHAKEEMSREKIYLTVAIFSSIILHISKIESLYICEGLIYS